MVSFRNIQSIIQVLPIVIPLSPLLAGQQPQQQLDISISYCVWLVHCRRLLGRSPLRTTTCHRLTIRSHHLIPSIISYHTTLINHQHHQSPYHARRPHVDYHSIGNNPYNKKLNLNLPFSVAAKRSNSFFHKIFSMENVFLGHVIFCRTNRALDWKI